MTWLLLIFVTGTADIVQTEKGFTSQAHCEKRAAVWRSHISEEKYTIACMRSVK